MHSIAFHTYALIHRQDTPIFILRSFTCEKEMDARILHSTAAEKEQKRRRRRKVKPTTIHCISVQTWWWFTSAFLFSHVRVQEALTEFNERNIKHTNAHTFLTMHWPMHAFRYIIRFRCLVCLITILFEHAQAYPEHRAHCVYVWAVLAVHLAQHTVSTCFQHCATKHSAKSHCTRFTSLSSNNGRKEERHSHCSTTFSRSKRNLGKTTQRFIFSIPKK